jgi:hypothetical protein
VDERIREKYNRSRVGGRSYLYISDGGAGIDIHERICTIVDGGLLRKFLESLIDRSSRKRNTGTPLELPKTRALFGRGGMSSARGAKDSDLDGTVLSSEFSMVSLERRDRLT